MDRYPTHLITVIIVCFQLFSLKKLILGIYYMIRIKRRKYIERSHIKYTFVPHVNDLTARTFCVYVFILTLTYQTIYSQNNNHRLLRIVSLIYLSNF